jgi:hypothetical protein
MSYESLKDQLEKPGIETIVLGTEYITDRFWGRHIDNAAAGICTDQRETGK